MEPVLHFFPQRGRLQRRLDEFALEGDADRIVEAYHEIGFFSAAVEAKAFSLSKDRVAVEFVVEEGQQAILEKWSLEILPRPDAEDPPSAMELDELLRTLDVSAGEAFGSKLYRDQRAELLTACAELGFSSARITGGARVDPDEARAEVEWHLDLGPRMYFGSIRIEGLDHIDEKIVRRELLIKEGERFSPSAIAQSERRLVATGLLRSVAIGRPQTREEDAETRADRIDLEIRADEAPPRSFRASIGYGTEDGPRGEVSLVWRNFTGEARRLNTRAFASLLDAGFEASLGQPYIWGERARGDLAVSALRQERPGYEAFITGASALLTIYPDRAGPWSLTIGPGVELAQILDFGIDVSERLRGPRQSVPLCCGTIGLA